ncbi:uncharacterized protein LOC110466641 isoform X1 [Mizuhopecten yessoensis]|uniref:uncharacterized protein LOC110449513 isoform X1 n=1 Tax=Mizuhopecten yessoensis TaxID=6573 RepID=UPI000B45A671|nr:uncharacterized protein LOC110449513 isoform X1 [Mizuhopecten yessoensis]XP_021352100.1 uncharacterized protein LOC110449513 isoform X1 [Mizuhopecten yessoensis]XP_021378951.1 uncharacterized protein LOC110466641 isoform X1 [Mizuhopecten yessoensis]XP_021378952.1 uncharacterized protein LOC110466641 isoform X1 [Mizuhopecten yessoensis]
MVLFSKKILFEIIDNDQFRDKPMNDYFVRQVIRKIEDKIFVKVNPSESDLKNLKSLIFKLKDKAKKQRKLGGFQFRKFLSELSSSAFEWQAPVDRHECENVLKEHKEMLLKCQEENKKLTETILLNVKNNNIPECSKPLGRKFSELTKSGQSKRRKVERETVKKSLKFLDKENIKPLSVSVERENGKKEVLVLRESKEKQDMEENSDELSALLYILDTFNISREAYAELSMYCKELPRRHVLQEYVNKLNTGFKIVDTPNGLGVQQSLKTKLLQVLNSLTAEDNKFAPDGKIKIKLSGDGTNVGKRLHVVNVSFTVINEKRCRAASGNYPLCVMNSKEAYSELADGLRDLRQEVGELQDSSITVDGRDFTIEILLGGDYKFLLVAVGIPCIASEYFCVYCKCSKSEKCKLDLEWSMEDVTKGARSLYECPDGCLKARKKISKKAFSVVNPPLFPHIGPLRVVVDPLHMFLRITDKLFNLLIAELRTLDNINGNTTFNTGVIDRSKVQHVAKLETVLEQLGIHFSLSVNRDTKRLEYRDLIGPEKLKLMKSFCANDLISDDGRAEILQKVWDGFSQIEKIMKSETPDADELEERTKEWCLLYVEAFQSRDITPYIHILRCHAHELIRRHGDISSFTQQGLEKLNDTITKQYFRGSCHKPQLALRQIMEKQNRISILENSQRQKSKTLKCSCCGGADHNKISCGKS